MTQEELFDVLNKQTSQITALLAECARLNDEIAMLRVQEDATDISRAEIDRLRAEVKGLRAERKTLWRQVPATEGTVMTYAAVHVVRWRPEWGEPVCGFVQAEREDGDA